MTKKVETEYIPNSSDAEKWLSPDIFIVDGELYELRLDFTVVRLNGAQAVE